MTLKSNNDDNFFQYICWIEHIKVKQTQTYYAMLTLEYVAEKTVSY